MSNLCAVCGQWPQNCSCQSNVGELGDAAEYWRKRGEAAEAKLAETQARGECIYTAFANLEDEAKKLRARVRELKASRPNYCCECGTGVGLMCSCCVNKHMGKLRSDANALAGALERTKKLTMGPSFELQDSIMVDVFSALAAHKALERGEGQ